MKLKIILLLLFTFIFQDAGIAQVIKIDRVGDRAKQRAESRKRQKENQAIDKGLDAVEGIFKKKKKKAKKSDIYINDKGESVTLDENGNEVRVDKKGNILVSEEDNSAENPTSEPVPAEEVKAEETEKTKEALSKSWAEFDFVPGDKVMFYDDLGNEESGEFPSRWDINMGSAENGHLDEEAVIRMTGRRTSIFPYMESGENYLPEQFTIEFDIHFSTHLANQHYQVLLWDKDYFYGQKKDGYRYYPIRIKHHSVIMGEFNGELKELQQSKELGWRRISLSYNKGYLKVYVNGDKVISIPRMKIKPTMFALQAESDPRADYSMVKNVRIAEGGDKLYDRIMADGKYVTHGINFDYNSATIKPESMGIINNMYNLLEKYPDLAFRIEGHSDSDGSSDYNLELSAKRAAAVKSALIKKGIDSDRLQSAGLGESAPLNENITPEDKANNRRVEFIKL